jgi:hypothetical protein
LIDQFIGRCLVQRNSQVTDVAVAEDSVPVYPAIFDEVNIVIHNKLIYSGYQLPIPEVRKKIRLHDG